MKGNEGPKGQNERKFPKDRNGQILFFQGQKWTKKLKKSAFPGTEMANTCFSKHRNGQNVPFQGQNWRKCTFPKTDAAKIYLSKE